MDQFHAAARLSHRRFQSFVGATYGVAWERNYFLSDSPVRDYPASEDSPMRARAVDQRDLERHEHPFAARHVRVFETMMVETPHYLRRIEEDARAAGADIVVREFHDVSELAALPERTIFNCAGLGAGALFGDGEIVPMRGQLAILIPQPEVDYNVISSDGYYMFGRADGVVLGGTFERGEWSLTPDPNDIARILAGNKAIFDYAAGA